MRASTGTEARIEEIGINGRSSPPPRRAVGNGVKISTGVKPFLKADTCSIGTTELEMLPSWSNFLTSEISCVISEEKINHRGITGG
jgi:hypothetical protein